MHTYATVAQWHRTLCPVTDQIAICGDLHEDQHQAITQLEGWQRAGVTHVLDTRYEWSDEDLVALHAPGIVYRQVGTDDDGRGQPDAWFDAGVAFATRALASPDSMLLVHCHMGINRGPSMAYRILLQHGWDPIEALDAIRNARPIADIGYAPEALDHFHRIHDVPQDTRIHDRDRLDAWFRGYPTTGLRFKRTAD